jgi:hypothetical protein
MSNDRIYLQMQEVHIQVRASRVAVNTEPREFDPEGGEK